MAGHTPPDLEQLLTPREREVLDLLRLGLTNAEIGERLDISADGAKYHVSEIIGKLGVRNRREAAYWPERPPWWATAVAPLASLWRAARRALPAKAAPVALAASITLALALLAALGVMAFLLVRDGGEASEIVISGEEIQSLDGYAFTSAVDLSSATGDLRASFQGVFQSPNELDGTLEAHGELAEGFGLAAQMELVLIGDLAWWRSPGGDWHVPDPTDADVPAAFPFLVFGSYATPCFYLQALEFDSLRLTTTGPPQTINDVRAYPVRFDKEALIATLDHGTFAKEPNSPTVREDAQQMLPEDMVVQAWLAEDGNHPVRIEVTLSSDESDEFEFFFAEPLSIHLQMDITDVESPVDVQPPQTGKPPPTPPEEPGAGECWLFPPSD